MSRLPDAWRPRAPGTALRALRVLLVVGAGLLMLTAGALASAGTPRSTITAAWVMAAVMVVLAASCSPRLAGTGLGDVTAATAMLLGFGIVALTWRLFGDQFAAPQSLMFVPVVTAALLFRRGVALSVVVACSVSFVVIPYGLPNRWGSAAAGVVDVLSLLCGCLAMGLAVIMLSESQDRLTARLTELARVDGLTGLHTRRALDEAVDEALDAVDPDDARGCTLLLVDLDHFKTVNDEHGHPTGDLALRHVAALLRDAAAQEGLPAVHGRLGGDELAVLLSGARFEDGLAHARRVAASVRRTPVPLSGGRRLELTVSVGVAGAPRHAVTRSNLYQQADRALYRAKRAGRDRVAVPAPETAPETAPGLVPGLAPVLDAGLERPTA